MNKEVTKCIATIDYFDQTLIVLSATSTGLLASVIGASVGVVSTSFSFAFSLTVENVKRNKIKKYEIKRKEIIILLLTRVILNSIVSTISKSLINSKISHENLSIKSQL